MEVISSETAIEEREKYDESIKAVAFVIMLCMVMVACSDSDDDAVGTEDVSVAFTLTVADATSTRADNDGWDDYSPAQDGILNENMVNTDDIIIAIYDDKGNRVDIVDSADTIAARES